MKVFVYDGTEKANDALLLWWVNSMSDVPPPDEPYNFSSIKSVIRYATEPLTGKVQVGVQRLEDAYTVWLDEGDTVWYMGEGHFEVIK